MSANMRYGDQLRRWREAAGLSQTELGRILGVQQQSVSKWEHHGMAFDATRFRRFDEVFNLPVGTARGAFVASAEASADDDEDIREELARVREEQARVQAEIVELRRQMGEIDARKTASARRSRARSGEQSPRLGS